MLKEVRQQSILEELYKEGKVNVENLSVHFEISKDTIRRDLSELEEQGILKRVYGGAIPYKWIPQASDARKTIEKNEKYLVAKKAIALMKPDTLIAIDGGTTNTLLASMIPTSMKLRVVTNSFPVVEELRKRPRIEVFFLGGLHNKESQTTVGDTVLQQLKGYHFDQCFIGAYAVDCKVGVTVPYPYDDEANIKKLIISNSSQVNIMASISKLEKTSNYVICRIEELDRILCEHPVTKAMQQKYQNKIC